MLPNPNMMPGWGFASGDGCDTVTASLARLRLRRQTEKEIDPPFDRSQECS